MHRYLLLFIIMLPSPLVFSAHHGNESTKHHKGPSFVQLKSAHSVTATVDKLEAILKKKGMTIFNRIDHAAGAKTVDLNLRPTQLLIFGNPKVGTKLMQCSQTVGIDLPLKMLIWEDEEGTTWLGYDRPKRLIKHHRIRECKNVIKKVASALQNFAQGAISK